MATADTPQTRRGSFSPVWQPLLCTPYRNLTLSGCAKSDLSRAKERCFAKEVSRGGGSHVRRSSLSVYVVRRPTYVHMYVVCWYRCGHRRGFYRMSSRESIAALCRLPFANSPPTCKLVEVLLRRDVCWFITEPPDSARGRAWRRALSLSERTGPNRVVFFVSFVRVASERPPERCFRWLDDTYLGTRFSLRLRAHAHPPSDSSSGKTRAVRHRKANSGMGVARVGWGNDGCEGGETTT